MDKPRGCSSFDVIRQLKKIIDSKKIGHAGTLDPIATGVLLIFFGKATKAIQYLENTDKEYITKFRFGLTTKTLDITGEVVKIEKSNITKEEVKNAVKNFEGKIEQQPPMYSAVKVGGVSLYKLARQGKVVDRKKRQVIIKQIECLSFNEKEQEGVLKIECSSGTYIRSLVYDIGNFLGVGGVVLELRRTRACGFSLKDCYFIDQLQKLKENNKLEQAIIDLKDVFKNFNKVCLDENEAKLFLNGVSLMLSENIEVYGKILVLHDDNLLGIAHTEKNLLKIDRVLYEKPEGF